MEISVEEKDNSITNIKISVFKRKAKCLSPIKIVSSLSINCFDENSIPSFESIVHKNKIDINLRKSFPFDLSIVTNESSN